MKHDIKKASDSFTSRPNQFSMLLFRQAVKKFSINSLGFPKDTILASSKMFIVIGPQTALHHTLFVSFLSSLDAVIWIPLLQPFSSMSRNGSYEEASALDLTVGDALCYCLATTRRGRPRDSCFVNYWTEWT